MHTDLNSRIGSWMIEPTRRVVDVAMAAVAAEGRTPADTELATVLAVSTPFKDAGNGIRTMSVHLPLLVYAAISDDVSRAIPLAAALLIFEAGVYALDHMMDRELAPPLDQWSTASIVLAATSLVGYVPQRIIADIDCRASTRVDLLRRLASGMSRIRQGQQMDRGGHPRQDG
jgi:hypothetical protein